MTHHQPTQSKERDQTIPNPHIFSKNKKKFFFKKKYLSHPLNQTVIGIRSFVGAREPLKPRVSGHSQSHPVLDPQFLQLC